MGAFGEDSVGSGVNGNQSGVNNNNTGAAYVFVRTGNDWAQEAYLKASNPEVGNEFGGKVAISGDAIVVGSRDEDSAVLGIDPPQDGTNVATNFGAAYYFVRIAGQWTQRAFLKAPVLGEYDYFGGRVALTGSTVVASARGEDSNAKCVDGNPFDSHEPDSGAVYVLEIEPASEVVRAGSPPNPVALQPGLTGPPVLGRTWEPVFEHTAFMSDAIIDFIGVSFGPPAEFVIAPYGTVLLSLTPAPLYFSSSPGVAFNLAIPDDMSIAGLAFVAQGFSVNAGMDTLLTNALDIVVGTYFCP